MTTRSLGRGFGRRLCTLGLLVAVAVAVAPAVSAPDAAAMRPDPPEPCLASVPPPSCGIPTGTFTSMTRQPAGLVVSGTAKDPDSPGSLQVQFRVDGSPLGSLFTNATTSSYSGTIPAAAGGTVCAVARNRNEGRDRIIGCHVLTLGLDPTGNLDEVSPGPAGLHVRGWSIDPDTAAPISVHIYVDNAFREAVTASASRPDVGAAYPGYASSHGFDEMVPAVPGPHTVCVYGINVGPGTVNTLLGCANVTQGAPPAAPGLTARALSQTTTIEIETLDNSNNEDGFTLERATSTNGPWAQIDAIGPLNGAIGSVHDDSNVTAGQSYCYRAKAWNAYGSNLSPVACATPVALPYPLPTNLSATGVTQTSVTLNWTDNAVGESWYFINRTGANTIILPGQAGTGPMSSTVTGLVAGTNYCFQIAAMSNGHGYHPATLCITTASAPPPPPPTRRTGIKTVTLWNCESRGLDGQAWYFDHTVGTWVEVGDVPSSWTDDGCGQDVTDPAISIDLPDQHVVTIYLVIVDGADCTVDDPASSVDCQHWKLGPVIGDANGPTVPEVVG
jgi:Fibronectin type III domain